MPLLVKLTYLSSSDPKKKKRKLGRGSGFFWKQFYLLNMLAALSRASKFKMRASTIEVAIRILRDRVGDPKRGFALDLEFTDFCLCHTN